MVLIIGLFFIFCQAKSFAQNSFLTPSDTLNVQRSSMVKTIGFSSSGIALSGLGYLWYADYDLVPFHFFDDSQEWKGMDKIGHSLSSYYGGVYSYKTLRWAGVPERKSVWYGGLYGWSFLMGVEILDGFSSGWGASPSDILANTAGSALFISQQLLWKDQRVVLKYSYWPSVYAQYRPETLGSSHWERWLKDYNGQTYWLSFNLNSLGLNNRLIPNWLNVAVGYGADGMLGGKENPFVNQKGEFLPYFQRSSQYYLSLDVDWKRIKTKSKFLKTLFYVGSFIKLPFPSLSYSNKGFSFHYLHY